MKNDIEALLIRRRHELNLTQSQVAKQLGVHQSTYNQWESGRSYPGENYIDRACTYLGIKKENLPPRPENL